MAPHSPTGAGPFAMYIIFGVCDCFRSLGGTLVWLNAHGLHVKGGANIKERLADGPLALTNTLLQAWK